MPSQPNGPWSGIQQIRMRRAEGLDSILTGMTISSEWGSSLSFGNPESQEDLVQPQSSISHWQSPKAAHRGLSLLPASSPQQHPIPSLASLLALAPSPTTFSPGAGAVLVHCSSCKHTGAHGGSWGQGGDVITMKDSNCVGKGPRTLVEKIVIQGGQPSKYQYLGQIQDSRMVSKEWCLNVTVVSPLELLGLVLSHPSPW